MSDLAKKLADPTHAEWSASWSSFLFNVAEVRKLGPVPAEAAAILSAGDLWRGEGWTTGKASKRLYDITSVALVSANVEGYTKVFIFALALHWGLEVVQYNLSEKSAEAAFALASVFSTAGDMEEDLVDEVDEEEDDEIHFPWEEQPADLPTDLQALWARYAFGTRFDTKAMLSVIPQYGAIPLRPPENNALSRWEQAGMAGKLDKTLKVQQQLLLHSLRVQARIYELMRADGAAGGAAGLLQQLWAYTAAAHSKLASERREALLPGSSPQDEDVLFGQEEIREYQAKRKLRDLRRGGFPPPSRCSFRGFPNLGTGKHFGVKGHGGRWRPWRPRMGQRLHLWQGRWKRQRFVSVSCPKMPLTYASGRGFGTGKP